jgi:hypothetical protein
MRSSACLVVFPLIEAFVTVISRPYCRPTSVKLAEIFVTQPLWIATPCPKQIESPKKKTRTVLELFTMA